MVFGVDEMLANEGSWHCLPCPHVYHVAKDNLGLSDTVAGVEERGNAPPIHHIVAYVVRVMARGALETDPFALSEAHAREVYAKQPMNTEAERKVAEVRIRTRSIRGLKRGK